MAEQQDIQTLEKGDIFFFYRPRVEEEHPEGTEDVQQVYTVLRSEDSGGHRLAAIGRKRLPSPEAHGVARQWGFIDLVRKDSKAIRAALEAETYETKTLGRRHQPGARPAGEGVYRILRHGDHTHLVYALELPERSGEVQAQLNLEPEASYIISVKNPEKGSPQAAGLRSDRQAEYPEDLQRRFRGRRFAELDPPAFLDYEGAEFVLISAHEDPASELGVELDPENESRHSADVFEELRLEREQRTIEPLLAGRWE